MHVWAITWQIATGSMVKEEKLNDGDGGRHLLSTFTQFADNNWIFVAHRPISADTTTYRVKQD